MFGTKHFEDLQYRFSGPVVLKLTIGFDNRQVLLQRLFIFSFRRQRLSQIEFGFDIVRIGF